MKNKDCGDCKNDERELCKKHSIEEIERALQSLENDPQLPPDIFDHSSNSNSSNDDHDSDDDIQVVKADIYKFHGQEETSLDQQVNEGILKFEFRDEDDDDILEIDVIDKRAEKRELVDVDKDSEDDTDNDDEEENEDRIPSCEECGKFVKGSEFTEHKEDMHPGKKKKFKQFQNGMFMMLAE